MNLTRVTLQTRAVHKHFKGQVLWAPLSEHIGLSGKTHLQLSSTCLLKSSSAGKTWLIGAKNVCINTNIKINNTASMQET